jgi:glutamine synthetase
MTDFDRYRVLWPDHLGLARGKYLPARVAQRGTSFCIGVFVLGYDRGMYPVDVGADMTGFPDLDTRFDVADARPGWEAGTAVVVADLIREGELFPTAPRSVLRRAVADWEALGYRPKIGLELEAYVFQPDGGGGWRPYDTPGAVVYGTGPITDPAGLVDELMVAAAASGLPLDSVNTEFDYPQFELTLEYGDAIEAVDNAFVFKEMARELASRRGLRLTFMGRPIAGRAGSGLHVNLSLEAGDGTNAFADPAAGDGLSGLAHHCIAGILAHHRGLSALCAPTVNAYKRLVPGELVGQWANWGYDHRCAAIRVPPHRGRSTRLEQRTSDGAANPYTAAAALLQAARLGAVNRLVPPPPETGDGIETVNTTVRCAPDLDTALDDLEADAELVAAVGPALVANLVGIKRVEWRSYVEAVADPADLAVISDWELETYQTFH